MESPQLLPDQFVQGIDKLSIDASTIIYMLKTGILGYVAAEISLFSSEGVIDEVGWPRLPVQKVSVPESLNNDDSVIFIAEQKEIPLASEDQGVLKKAEDKSIPFFNALMILNYLLYKKRINKEDFPEYLNRLIEVSRYSEKVLNYGKAIQELVEKELEIV